MKRIAISTVCALVAGTLGAQDHGSWINVQGAGIFQVTKPTGDQLKLYPRMDKDDAWLDNSLAFGGGLGTWFTPRWGGELSALYTKIDWKEPYGTRSNKEAHGFASLLFNLSPDSTSWSPYLRGGIGLTHQGHGLSGKAEKTNALNAHLGLGAHFYPTESFQIGVEGRAVQIFNSEWKRTELQALVSLGYRWGAASAAPLPPPPPLVEPEPPRPQPAPEPKPEPKPEPVPAPQPVVVPPPPPPPPPPTKIVLDEAMLHFANGKADITPEGVGAVKTVATELKKVQGAYSLVVTGHTSASGSKVFNTQLSKRRADAVAAVLVGEGIPASAISTLGAGPDKPIADNATPAGQAKNRRVEIDVKVQGMDVETRTITTTVQEDSAPAVKKPVAKKKVKAPSKK